MLFGKERVKRELMQLAWIQIHNVIPIGSLNGSFPSLPCVSASWMK